MYSGESDPDAERIKIICESLVGTEIINTCNITMPTNSLFNGESTSDPQMNVNAIGDIFESCLFKILKERVNTITEGPRQASPDYYNSPLGYEFQSFRYESKCFNKKRGPGFDIANVVSFFKQLENDFEKKVFKTKYLIFEYKIEGYKIEITRFKFCDIWKLLNYNGKNIISIQKKNGIFCNIRPCCFADMNIPNKTPQLFVDKICEFLEKEGGVLNMDIPNVVRKIKSNFANCTSNN
tara:strand:+ start:139 stop:852 length:714 start_codon:yes stop_codon:yes gene_type:complete